MTNYSVDSAAGEVGVHRKTLAAGGEDVVTFTTDLDRVEVVNLDGIDSIFVTVDGSPATVDGSHTYELPGGAGTLSATLSVEAGGPTKVRVISPGAAKYTAQRAPY